MGTKGWWEGGRAQSGAGCCCDGPYQLRSVGWALHQVYLSVLILFQRLESGQAGATLWLRGQVPPMRRAPTCLSLV